MRLILAAFAALVLYVTPAPARASEASDIIGGIQRMVDAYNKHDDAALASAFTAAPVIMDDFPPFTWQGSGSVAGWKKDLDADNKTNAVTGATMSVSRPSYASIDGDRGYAVANSVYAFTEQGKPQRETGILTLSLEKVDQVWRISGMAWARR